MKFKALSVIAILAMVAALLGAASSSASAAAYGTSFVTSVTYMNIGTGPANAVTLTFYAENSAAPITIPLPVLPKNGGSSIYIGSVSEINSGFKGSAVMSSDQPLAATLVQLPPSSSTVKNRPLSNGFSSGSDYVLIPTALKATFSTNSTISIQNVDSVGADIAVKFVPTTGSAVQVNITNLPTGSAKYLDLGKMNELPATFNGSVQITAKKTGTNVAGSVVATSLEAATNSDSVYAFEGVPTSTADTIYMPSAFCKFSGGIDSAYAIQNTGTGTTNIKVTYNNGKSETKTGVGPGSKVSFAGCGAGNPAGYIGSAIVTTVPAGGTIVGIAKIGGNGLSTAFVGITKGAEKLNVPYVRWTEAQWSTGARQRTNIAIQNVGTALPAGAVTVEYYDRNGVLVGTDTLGAIAAGGKVSSNAHKLGAVANEFGYSGTAIGGSAVVKGPAGSKLAVVARVATFINSNTSVGEDYNGIPPTP